MKTALAIALLLAVVAGADEFGSIETRQAVQAAAVHRHRFIDQQLYDLGPLFNYFTNVHVTARPLNSWALLVGEVVQITGSDGIILRTHKLSGFSEAPKTVRILNHPLEKKLVDGKLVACVAAKSGRFRYQNVQGAVATIESYDYGRIATPQQVADFMAKK
jgi:hypothetical protein